MLRLDHTLNGMPGAALGIDMVLHLHAAALLAEHDRLTEEVVRLQEEMEADRRELADLRDFLRGVARQLDARAALPKETT